MKASLDVKGALVIEPENGTEAFALKHWIEEWQEKRVTLLIRFDGNLNPVDPYPGQEE